MFLLRRRIKVSIFDLFKNKKRNRSNKKEVNSDRKKRGARENWGFRCIKNKRKRKKQVTLSTQIHSSYRTERGMEGVVKKKGSILWVGRFTVIFYFTTLVYIGSSQRKKDLDFLNMFSYALNGIYCDGIGVT